MPFERGDVVLVLFPDSNLRTAKRRPVLIVPASSLNSGMPQVVVAMISSNLARAGHPSQVPIERDSVLGRKMGLRTESVVMTDNLATILHAEIARTLGACDAMEPIDSALRHTLGL